MKVFFQILFACFVGGSWYHLSGGTQPEISIMITVLLLIVSLIKPIKYQDPAERDEYRHKIQEARARRLIIKEKQMQEKIELKKQMQREEEMRKKELKEKLKL